MAMWGALAAQSALALGLGDIELKSALNQPLRAEVQLLSVTERELQELRVALASAEVFQQAGIDRPAFLSHIRFEPVRKPDGSAVIQLTSREAVREPFLDFMLEVVWANGKLVRAYTVLVDPPVTMPAPTPTAQLPAARAPAPAPARTTAPRPAAPTPAADVGTHSGDTYGPTGRNDTLWNIAAKVRPDGVGMEQAMLGLLKANPGAFIGHNINNLKAGYVLRVPDRAEFTSISTADASAEVRTQNREWREGRV
ncbi:MAG: FimV family protein, partial [Gammaproteobacteria bacterium]